MMKKFQQNSNHERRLLLLSSKGQQFSEHIHPPPKIEKKEKIFQSSNFIHLFVLAIFDYDYGFGWKKILTPKKEETSNFWANNKTGLVVKLYMLKSEMFILKRPILEILMFFIIEILNRSGREHDKVAKEIY